MKSIFLICCAAVILSCTTASSQMINHIAQIDASVKSDTIFIAGKKRRSGLSGQSGNVRKRGPRGRGSCAKGYKKYIAASGHSAYAQTPSRGYSGGAICGWSINGPSAKSTEKAALRGCTKGLKKYKVGISGKCTIFASK